MRVCFSAGNASRRSGAGQECLAGRRHANPYRAVLVTAAAVAVVLAADVASAKKDSRPIAAEQVGPSKPGRAERVRRKSAALRAPKLTGPCQRVLGDDLAAEFSWQPVDRADYYLHCIAKPGVTCPPRNRSSVVPCRSSAVPVTRTGRSSCSTTSPACSRILAGTRKPSRPSRKCCPVPSSCRLLPRCCLERHRDRPGCKALVGRASLLGTTNHVDKTCADSSESLVRRVRE